MEIFSLILPLYYVLSLLFLLEAVEESGASSADGSNTTAAMTATTGTTMMTMTMAANQHSIAIVPFLLWAKATEEAKKNT